MAEPKTASESGEIEAICLGGGDPACTVPLPRPAPASRRVMLQAGRPKGKLRQVSRYVDCERHNPLWVVLPGDRRRALPKRALRVPHRPAQGEVLLLLKQPSQAQRPRQRPVVAEPTAEPL